MGIKKNKPKQRVTVTLEIDKYSILLTQAKIKGLPLPTYCRLLLSEFAEVPLKV